MAEIKQKIPCGGFYVGGLQVDNGTLSYGGLVKKEYYCPGILDPNQKQYFDLYIAKGDLKQYDDDASNEVKNFFTALYLIVGGSGYANWEAGKKHVRFAYAAYQAGLISAPFTAFADDSGIKSNIKYQFTVSNKYIYVNNHMGSAPIFYRAYYSYNYETDSFSYGIYQQNLYMSAQGVDALNPTLTQVSMSTDPTTNMQIATKQYVDNLALPTVTTADNGKVLKVVDGAWAIADA